MEKIVISKSPTADNRTCDFSKVTPTELAESSKQHILDVRNGLDQIRLMLFNAGMAHDYTKLTNLGQFHKDFIGGFKSTAWYENHVVEERHHLTKNVPEDVNLVDVIECLVDGVMAGMARSGEYRKEELPEGLLQKAFDNTVKLLIDAVVIEETIKPEEK